MGGTTLTLRGAETARFIGDPIPDQVVVSDVDPGMTNVDWEAPVQTGATCMNSLRISLLFLVQILLFSLAVAKGYAVAGENQALENHSYVSHY